MLIAIVSPCSVFALMSGFVLIRDEFVQPKNPEKWKLIVLFHALPWWVWVMATLILMMIVVIEGAVRYSHPSAAQLPPQSPKPTTTAEEQYWNLRRTSEAPELVRKYFSEPLGSAPTEKSLPRQWLNGPIVEPEVIQSADLRSVNVFVANLGDDAAIDVTIAPIGGGSISFGVVRVLMASEPKAKVPIFIGADVPMLSLLDSRSEFLVAWEHVKRKNVEKSRGALCYVAYVRSYSGTTVAGYVPLCLTYNYSHGRSFHTHAYVLADVSEYQIAIRRKSDSEAVLGASPEHA
ncbi:MAG TPA: hypothetical protein VN380_13515 [Thermoanaerobaculia bacterium]|nr:hypothetical protein [Thermoanaerobaculia bacterium]